MNENISVEQQLRLQALAHAIAVHARNGVASNHDHTDDVVLKAAEKYAHFVIDR